MPELKKTTDNYDVRDYDDLQTEEILKLKEKVSVTNKFTPATTSTNFFAFRCGDLVHLSFGVVPVAGWMNSFNITDPALYPINFVAFSTSNNSGADGSLVLSGGIANNGVARLHSDKDGAGVVMVSAVYLIK